MDRQTDRQEKGRTEYRRERMIEVTVAKALDGQQYPCLALVGCA